MTDLFTRHKPLLESALKALETREFWTPFPEVPSGKIYGETAKEEGESSYAALLGSAFDLPGHPEDGRVGSEVSPWGPELGITYPAAASETLIAASEAAAPAFADSSVEVRTGALLEALVRLNKMSFLLGHATMHTTGQAFAMAFQAGGRTRRIADSRPSPWPMPS